MDRTFFINGRKYVAAPFSFNTICDMEELGVSVKTLGQHPTSGIRAYLALSMGTSLKDAGNELEQHLISGGKLDSLIKAMTEEMNDSNFLKSLMEKQATTETTTETKKTVTKKK